MVSDSTLLQKYIDSRDAEAFSEIANRYSGMVFGTCQRIIGNAHDAEDMAQECFIALAKQSEVMSSPMAGWLHRTATNKSLNVIRDEKTRKKYEVEVLDRDVPEDTLRWEEVAPHIDTALAELSEELRDVLVLHFLQGKGQAEVAQILEVNQSTVSRRVEKGVEQLRYRMKKAGIVVSVLFLTTQLTQNAVAAAPATLTASVGKIAISGFGQSASGAGAAGAVGKAGALMAKVIPMVLAVAVVIGAVLVSMNMRELRTVSEAQLHGDTVVEDLKEEGMAEPVIIQSVVDIYNEQFPKGWEKKEVVAGPHAHFWFHLWQMQTAGWKDIDLDTVVALSGASALFAYDPKSFMPKYAFHYIGIHDRIAKATGFGYEWLQYGDIEDAWDILKESLDSGRPISAAYAEDILFAGYQESETKSQRKVFAIILEPDNYGKWWSWDEFEKWANGDGRSNGSRMGRHTARVATESPKTVALRVMNDLVAWLSQPPENVRQGFPNAHWGSAAVELCAEHSADIKGRKEWGFCHNLNSQWPLRKSSAVYLESVAKQGIVGNIAGEHLRKAAYKYRQAYAEWVVAYKQVSWGGPEKGDQRRETRMIASAALKKAAEYERGAIDEIRAALNSEKRVHSSEGDKVARTTGDILKTIEGLDEISPLTWQRAIPFFGSLEAATKPFQNPIGYDEALVFSGHGVGFRWWVGGAKTTKRWCVSSMDLGYSDSETDSIESVATFFNWELQPVWYAADMSDAEHQNIFKRVTDSIDTGNPVLCAPYGNMSLIVGYTKEERVVHLRQYGNADRDDLAAMSLKNMSGPPYLIFMANKNMDGSKKPRSLDVALKALGQRWDQAAVPYANGSYLYGALAWESVQETLAGFDSLPEDEQKQFISTVTYTLQRVRDARNASLRFILNIGNDGRESVETAAKLVADILQDEINLFAQYPWAWDPQKWGSDDLNLKLSALKKLVPALSEKDAKIVAAIR